MDIEGIKSLIRVAPGVKNIEEKGSLLKFTLLSDVEAQLEIVKGVGSLFLYAILSEIPKYTQYRLPLLEDVLMGNYFSQLTGKFQIALSPDKELLLLFIEIKGRQIKELTSYIEKFNYYYFRFIGNII